MISAGVKFLETYPTFDNTTKIMSNVEIQIKYTATDQSNPPPPEVGDIIIDSGNNIWEIMLLPQLVAGTQTNYKIGIKNTDVTKQAAQPEPAYATVRGLISTPLANGTLRVPFDQTLTTIEISRIAYNFSYENMSSSGGISSEVTFDNTTSQITATTVQEALDYIFTTGVGGGGTSVTNNATTPVPYSTLKADSNNVNGALVMRDNSGNFKATEIDATALRAKYADYAERYTCKDNVSVGDVVSICPYDDYDIELCRNELSHNVIGIVSQNPGHLINSDCDGPAIARIGKIRGKVIGTVRNGDVLVSAGNGCLRAVQSYEELPYRVAFSCEANILEDIKLIEVII